MEGDLTRDWPELEDRIKQRWSRLRTDDLQLVEGDLRRLPECLQRRYRQTRAQAVEDWTDFCASVRKERRANPNERGALR